MRNILDWNFDGLVEPHTGLNRFNYCRLGHVGL